MPLILILIPAVLAALAALLPSDRLRPWLLPLGALGHLAGTLILLFRADPFPELRWLVLDPPGRLVLLLLTLLFLICSFYAVGYLRYRADRPNRIFCTCLLGFLAAATLVVCAQHLGLMWVATEATTLCTAPLIYFNRTPRSIEATWKYLLICSVGIAIALLGSFFLAYAALQPGAAAATAAAPATQTAGEQAGAPVTLEASPSLVIADLVARGQTLSRPWLTAAFVLLLVGYGTKMGLAPMHTWKPDAYGEAPGVVGALMAGGLTSCAFLVLLRAHHVCAAAGAAPYVDRLLIFMGLLSMGVAGAFMVDQRDFKRMLAYSSVEHMGILILGIGIGGGAVYGALLHMLNNGLTKGVLFLSAGNIHRAYGSKTTDLVRGAIRRLPISGTMFLLGFFAITGSPPFGPFVSEFRILLGAFEHGRFIVAALFLLFLLIVFVGMGRTVLAVVQGRPPAAARRTAYRDGVFTALPIVASLGAILLLGLYIPPPLHALLTDAAKYLAIPAAGGVQP